MRKFIDHDSFVCNITIWNIIRDTISINKEKTNSEYQVVNSLCLLL